jgi:SEC-C motif-containing protein
MTETDDRCPCGTGETFGECCGRYLQDGRVAPTAEALMRSRYTGFATRAVHYLLATWHPSTRPDELELDEDMVWRRLDVLRTDAGGPWDDAGTVEFVAHYRLDDGTAIGQRGRLHETSRFVREDGRWLYVDGGIGA